MCNNSPALQRRVGLHASEEQIAYGSGEAKEKGITMLCLEQRRVRGVFVLLVAFAMLPFSVTVVRAQTTTRCFSETGFCVTGRLLQYWQANGGLPVFGLPISPQRVEQTTSGSFQAQWFERARLELHPEAKAPYDVQLGRLGVDALTKQGRDWFSFPRATAAETGNANCRLFTDTGHTVCGEFLTAFRSYGLAFPGVSGISAAESLALFGLPVSQPMTETTPDGKQLQVQWFERARFEFHPENKAPYRVQFGRLGAEVLGPLSPAPQPTAQPGTSALAGTFWQLTASGLLNAPVAPVAGGQPVRLAFGSDGSLNGSNGCNSFSGTFTDDGKQITFGALRATQLACTAEVDQQERGFFNVMSGSRRYERTSDQLKVFYNNDASALVYRAMPSITGTVSYKERIALPAGATVIIQLLDISRADAPAVVIARQVIPTNGKQVPFNFVLPYDIAQISPTGTYGVRAEIRLNDQLLFTTSQSYQVITNGKPSKIDVVVTQV